MISSTAGEGSMNDEYLTIAELSAYSKLCRATLRKLLPEIPHTRVGRKTIVKRSDFDWWARRRQREHERASPLVRALADEITGKAS